MAHQTQGHGVGLVLEAISEEEILRTGVVALIPLLPLCRVTEDEIATSAPGWRKRIEESELGEQEKVAHVVFQGLI